MPWSQEDPRTGNVFLDMGGKTLQTSCAPSERTDRRRKTARWRSHKGLCVEVRNGGRGPRYLFADPPGLVKRLFELEVPKYTTARWNQEHRPRSRHAHEDRRQLQRRKRRPHRRLYRSARHQGRKYRKRTPRGEDRRRPLQRGSCGIRRFLSPATVLSVNVLEDRKSCQSSSPMTSCRWLSGAKTERAPFRASHRLQDRSSRAAEPAKDTEKAGSAAAVKPKRELIRVVRSRMARYR